MVSLYRLCLLCMPSCLVKLIIIVLYSRDHKKVGVAHEITSPKNQPQFSQTAMRQYWLAFNKLLRNFKFFILRNFLLIPSDNRNSIMAKATGLIYSLFNVASSQGVPFGILQYVQCIFHGLTSVLLCVPFIFADSERCRFGGST